MQTYQVYVIVFGQQMTTEIQAESEQDLLQQVQQQAKEKKKKRKKTSAEN